MHTYTHTFKHTCIHTHIPSSSPPLTILKHLHMPQPEPGHQPYYIYAEQNETAGVVIWTLPFPIWILNSQNGELRPACMCRGSRLCICGKKPVCMYVCMRLCICGRKPACIHICMYACMRLCIWGRKPACTYVNMWRSCRRKTYMYVCLCVCMCVCMVKVDELTRAYVCRDWDHVYVKEERYVCIHVCMYVWSNWRRETFEIMCVWKKKQYISIYVYM